MTARLGRESATSPFRASNPVTSARPVRSYFADGNG
jgi:hypothetical protein